MAKPYSLPPFTVVVDTNAIYPKDPLNVIGPQFTNVWKECLAITKLQLVISEVVRGERLYQMTAWCRRLIQSAKQNLKSVHTLSRCQAKEIPNDDEIKKGIEQKFDAWVKEYDARIAPVPYETMDWKRVVNDAIWREKPFEIPLEKEKNSEKGFRDCLVLATLTDVVKQTKGHQVAFITNYALLKEAVAKFDSKQFAVYENIVGFSSFLKLNQQEKDREYSQAVLHKAPTVFYKPDDPNCVYTKLNVKDLIKQQFAYLLDSFLDTPATNHWLSGLSGLVAPDYSTYTPPATAVYALPGKREPIFFNPTSEENVSVESTELDNQAKDGLIQWKSKVQFARLFDKPLKEGERPILGAYYNEIVRVQPFNVLWTCYVSTEIEFQDVTIAEIKPEARFTTSAWLEKEKYGFPAAEPGKWLEGVLKSIEDKK